MLLRDNKPQSVNHLECLKKTIESAECAKVALKGHCAANDLITGNKNCFSVADSYAKINVMDVL